MTRPDFCANCPISKFTQGYVPPKVEDSEVLIVGEAAGENEILVSKPFVGKAGLLLKSLLAKANIPKDNCNIINTIGCQPFHNNYPGSPKWTYTSNEQARAGVAHCRRHHLEPFLLSRNWSKIIALGDHALKATTNRNGITTWRGSPLPFKYTPNEPPKVLPTFHPSYLGRVRHLQPAVVGDLRKSLTIPEEKYIFNDIEALRNFHSLKFAFDLEWDAQKNITLCGISDKFYTAIVSVWEEPYISELERIFTNATDLIGWAIINADLPYLEKLDWNISANLHDTMLKQHLIQPNYPHSLAFSGSVFTNFPFWKGRLTSANIEDEESSTAPQYKTWGSPLGIPNKYGGYKDCSSDEEAFQLYNARDTARNYEIEYWVDKALQDQGLDPIYWNVSRPVALIVRDLEDHGWKIDSSRVGEIRNDLTAKITKLESILPKALRSYDRPTTTRIPAPKGLYKRKVKSCKGLKRDNTTHDKTVIEFTQPGRKSCSVCNKSFHSGKMTELKTVAVPSSKRITPWNSPKVLGDYAKSLNLKEVKHLKTGEPTVDKRARKRWAKEHSEFTIIDQIKKHSTILNTFAKPSMLKEARLYFNLKVHGTSEGRFSSSAKRKGIDCNIQNQPEEVRKIFVPDYPHWGILDQDYSSGENFLTAHLAGDTDRLARLRTPGYDEHAHVASLIFDQDCNKGSDGQYLRPVGKIINHGTNYGMGIKTLMENLLSEGFNYTEGKVRKFIGVIQSLNKGTYEWQKRTIAEASQNRYLTNAFGRKAFFTQTDWASKALAFLPASTLADIMIRVMIATQPSRFYKELEFLEVSVSHELAEGWRLITQVHDSIISQGPDETWKEQSSIIESIMTQPWAALDGFSLSIDTNYSGKGGSWGDCK